MRLRLTSALRVALWPVLATVALHGCATLPVIRLSRQLPLSQSSEPITFEGPHGALSDARADVASEKLAEAGADSVLDAYLGMSAQLIGEPLVIGNRVDLLVDGPQTYAAMFAAIRAAQRTLDIESYIFDDVTQGEERLSALLAERVRAGVAVRVLVDGVGSMGSEKTLGTLEAAGIRTCVFNPVTRSIWNPVKLNHRDHRKIVVVDGDDAFAGGINFSSVYRSGSSMFSNRATRTVENGWRDTHVRIQGPGARSLAGLFADSWKKQGCPDPAEPAAPDLPRLDVPKGGETVIQVIPSSPDAERNLTYVSVLGAVAFARKSISVTMAYFIPDDRLEDELVAAAGRGVEVRMILPAFSDFTGVFHAGRSHYARLLAGGVHLYEQETAFLHAKTVVVDGIWSTVGSTNWDWRSFALNDEVSVVVIDEAFAGRMAALFEDDLANSSEVTAETWSERPWHERFLEGFWAGFERLL